MKLLFTTNVPSPYRVNFFNELGKKCDLTVIFEKFTSDERDDSWKQHSFDNFKGIILKGQKVNTDTAFAPSIIKYLNKDDYDVIIIGNPLTPTGLTAELYMISRKIPYCVEGDGGFPKNGTGFKEKIKEYIYSNAKKCFSTSKMHDEYYMTYGVKKENIIRYPFTSLYDNDIVSDILSDDEKEKLKEKLNIKEKKVVTYAGRIDYKKGIKSLLGAASMLNREIGFYLIGGKATDELLEFIQKNNLTNVHFIEFKPKEELKKFYKISNLFVLPTQGDVWGLVINEAMASGLPIITTDKCIAGLELIRNGENGYIVHADEPKILAEKIDLILNDDCMRQSMSYESLRKIKKYTFENMAEAHVKNLFEYVKKNEN